MKNFVFPLDDKEWNQEQFSVVQGFDICTLFLTYLWPSLEDKFQEMKEDDVVVYRIFSSVCMGFETSAEWNKAIYKVKNIRKEAQESIKLSPNDLFLCTIELCKIHNARFVEGSLSYLIGLLEDCYKHPKNHPLEWTHWQNAIKESFVSTFHPFSWLDDLQLPETEDTP